MAVFSNALTEYSPQMELESIAQDDFYGEVDHRVFDDYQQIELAINLMDIAHERQLDCFLDKVIRIASRNAGSPIDLSIQRAIRDALKVAACGALRRAMRERMASPLGPRLARALASNAGLALGLELEGLSGEDREFEAVRQFIRFAGRTVEVAASLTPNHDPAGIAHQAASEAAQLYAPGLMIEGRDATRRGSG